MKRTSLLLMALALMAFTVEPANEVLQIGDAAPLTDVEMLGVSGEMVTLEGVADENGLLVMYSCNTCPWVAAWEDRYPVIAALAEELDIGMIVLNPNAAYRDRGDGYEDMQKRAEKMGYTFPYVVDKDAALATAFGATRTPEAFLFNNELTLEYHGAIDDNARNKEAVEEAFLADAMKKMAKGETIETNETRSIGCSIKFP